MGTGKGLKGFRVLAVATLVAAPSLAYAHALLVNPVPRDTTDTKLKMGPCGGDAQGGPLKKGAPVAQYEAGAQVRFVYKETIAHGGCYQFRLSSTGDDKNFQILSQIPDPPNGTGVMDASIKLPDNVTCPNCTLQLLQIMRTDGGPCVADASPEPIANTQSLYYSCADIHIGDFADAGDLKDAGPPDEDASSQDEPQGPSTTPTDGGGKTSSSSGDNGASSGKNLRSGAGDDGCNVGWGATSGLSFFVSAGIGAMALLRRRRKS